jgi:hypothetical protein
MSAPMETFHSEAVFEYSTPGSPRRSLPPLLFAKQQCGVVGSRLMCKLKGVTSPNEEQGGWACAAPSIPSLRLQEVEGESPTKNKVFRGRSSQRKAAAALKPVPATSFPLKVFLENAAAPQPGHPCRCDSGLLQPLAPVTAARFPSGAPQRSPYVPVEGSATAAPQPVLHHFRPLHRKPYLPISMFITAGGRDIGPSSPLNKWHIHGRAGRCTTSQAVSAVVKRRLRLLCTPCYACCQQPFCVA